MSNYISQIVDRKIDFLKSSYDANKHVNHQGIKGSLNEVLLLELIRDVIPAKYKFTNGIIQDSNGFQSNESDIIIYDNEVLPAIILGNNLGFVPAESVEYTFEVKSTLDATEIKTTIKKFSNLLKSSGYRGRNSLFSFASDLNSKSELQRYQENDKSNFQNNPIIRILIVSERGYYFFDSSKIYLKDLIEKNEFAKIANNQNETSFMAGQSTVKISQKSDINIKGDLIINGLNYESLYVNINRWYGIESRQNNNDSFLAFLSGISNTLSRDHFGKYLMADSEENIKIYSECVVDMWGNVSYTNMDFQGYGSTKLNEMSYSISLTESGKNNKIKLYPG